MEILSSFTPKSKGTRCIMEKKVFVASFLLGEFSLLTNRAAHTLYAYRYFIFCYFFLDVFFNLDTSMRVPEVNIRKLVQYTVIV